MTTSHVTPPPELTKPLQQDWQTLLNALPPGTKVSDAARAQLEKVAIGSRFALDLALQHPDWLMPLLANPLADLTPGMDAVQRHTTALAGLQEGTLEQLEAGLRLYRNREMLGIIWRDLNRLVTPADTCRYLSDLADAAIDCALQYHYQRLCQECGTPANPQGQAQGFFVIGMGKLGAQELNLSSDIDLIFAYPQGGATQGGKTPLENSAFFTRLGQRLIKSLDTLTAQGFVFRVDMRLRPFGQSGALALSFDALEDYYHTQGREWERFAMIKARVVAHNGTPEQAQQLQQLLRAFTYRKYIDFSVIAALRNLKLMISREVAKKGKDDDVKLGRGGIREIEFIAQVFQLIRGGRDSRLQERSLEKTLRYLGANGTLPPGMDQTLLDAYWFLRNTEHALQAYQDRQTQALPQTPLEQARLAWVMGFSQWDGFYQQLQAHRDAVAAEFQAVITPAPEPAVSAEEQGLAPFTHCWLTLQRPDTPSLQLLEHWGFTDATGSLSLLIGLQTHRQILALHAQSRERLDAFMPRLLQALTRAQTPSQTLARLQPFVLAVARRSAYLLLLTENPQALLQLVTLSDSSPWICERLTQYPALLDELLNPASLYQIPTQQELAQDLRQYLLRIEDTDLEHQMEALRYFRWAQALKIAACEVTGSLPLMRVSDCLSDLAEVILDYALQLTTREMTQKHGFPDGEESLRFAIVGYGKLGGLELSHGSDLDLVFLHQNDPNGETRSPQGQLIKPLENGVFYTRLAQKIIHLLATKTAGGQVYDIDLRLRPSGNSGLLVTSLKAFEKYQRESAWTWEHQALVRARALCGSPELCRDFEQVRLSILCQARDPAKLQEDVRQMRSKMRGQLGSKKADQEAGWFHLKQDAGGIVDIEFMVQYLALAWAHADPSLVRYSDNIRILGSLENTGRLTSQEANQLIKAYKDYRSLGHRLALQQAPPMVQRHSLEEPITQVVDLWQRLLGT
jgi:[glutamine synthetase] adenylyltransferase / [glutamine synthetase]-adenylyl-L-tyrosine phosphorylase